MKFVLKTILLFMSLNGFIDVFFFWNAWDVGGIAGNNVRWIIIHQVDIFSFERIFGYAFTSDRYCWFWSTNETWHYKMN